MNDAEKATFYQTHAAEAIRYKTRSLVASGRLPEGEAEDFEQELALRVFARLDKFDPDRACPGAFCCVVVNSLALTLLKARHAASRDPARVETFDVNALATPGRSESDPARQQDLVLDWAAAIEGLSERQRRLLGLLLRMNVTKAAMELGIHRSTAYSDIALIRDRFLHLGLEDYL